MIDLSEFEFVLGFCIGLMACMAMFVIFIVPFTQDKAIQSTLEAQKDCLIKEYYFGNDYHRDFCDKIGVKP